MSKPEYRVLSFSGGKDSTAMLLRLLEEGVHIDCILFCDTGLEFPAMYRHIEKVEQAIGRPITRVQCEYSFEYLMLEHMVERKQNTLLARQYGMERKGYSWPGPKMRWCTQKLKDGPREAFLQPLREKYDVKEYVGIAADEQYRMQRRQNQQPNHVHPLIDWGMTEADCLRYCYERGYDWEGLYKHFSRVSCWCCPLQPLAELRQLYWNYPDLWAQLEWWESQTWRDFRADFSIPELAIRFEYEKSCLADGRSITSRAFFSDLRRLFSDKAASKVSDSTGTGANCV